MCYRSDRLETTFSCSRGQESDFKFECRLLCCKCSYCHRVATKERHKSQFLSNVHRNKICERCFLCRSLEFCKSCHKCPSCCHKSTCRGKVTKVLEEVGSLGCECKSSHHSERGLHPPLPVQTKLDQVTNCHKQLPQPSKTGQPFRGTVSAGKQKCSRTGRKSNNQLFLVPKSNNPWRPILDLSTLITFLNTESFKMETPETIRTSLQAGEWVSSIDFKDAYFHIPIHSQSRKYMCFHLQGRSYQFKALPFGLSTAPMEFTVVAKEVKLMALQRGIRIHQYLDDWLVRASSHETCLPTYTELGSSLPRSRLASEQGKVRAGPKTGFQLRRLPVRPERRQGQTHTRALAGLDRQDPVNSVWSGMSGPTVHVPHRSSHSNRKASPPRATSHEAHTVALQKQLEGPRITRQGDPSSQVAPPPPKVVARGKQCATRLTLTPSKTCSANIYGCIKRRVGRSLRRAHCKGNLVPSRKQVAHKSLRAKS